MYHLRISAIILGAALFSSAIVGTATSEPNHEKALLEYLRNLRRASDDVSKEHVAAISEMVKNVDTDILKVIAPLRQSVFDAALETKNDVVVKIVLSHGLQDRERRHIATYALTEIVKEYPFNVDDPKSSLRLINLVIDQGADVNEGLKFALVARSLPLTKLMLARGADVSHEIAEGSFLHVAIAQRVNGEIIKLLLERGADVNARSLPMPSDDRATYTPKTALEMAKEKRANDLVIRMLEHPEQYRPLATSSSSVSSRVDDDVIARPKLDYRTTSVADVRYYSPPNLERINDINKTLRALDKAELQRTKHAPLMIFADPENQEGKACNKSFKDVIHDVTMASFRPVILLNYLLLKNFVRENGTDTLKGNYRVFDVPDTQFAILIPHWFFTAYAHDNGLKLGSFVEKTALLESVETFFTWLKFRKGRQLDMERGVTVEYPRYGTATKLADKFAEDVGNVFLSKGDAPDALPRWDIYFQGHGEAVSPYSLGSIGGLPIKDFVKVLEVFSREIDVGVVYIQSCFVGGVNRNVLNNAIAELPSGPLPYHVILSSVGDTVTSNARSDFDRNPNQDSDKPYFVPEFTKAIENFFQDVAVLERDRTTSSSSTSTGEDERREQRLFAELSFNSLLVTLFELSTISGASLHGSEYIPQFKFKGSPQFELFGDPAGHFAIIDAEKARRPLILSPQTRTVIFDETVVPALTMKTFTRSIPQSWFERKHLYDEKTTRLWDAFVLPAELNTFANRMATAYGELDAYQRKRIGLDGLETEIATLSSQYFPTLLILPKSSKLDDKNTLFIEDLTLESGNPLAGIFKFLSDAFLTTLIKSESTITIATLTGHDDITPLLKHSELEFFSRHTSKWHQYSLSTEAKAFLEEVAKNRADNRGKLVLTNVVLSIYGTGSSLLFNLGDQRFSFQLETGRVSKYGRAQPTTRPRTGVSSSSSGPSS